MQDDVMFLLSFISKPVFDFDLMETKHFLQKLVFTYKNKILVHTCKAVE